jgi:AcrR family transcriptional regulator
LQNPSCCGRFHVNFQIVVEKIKRISKAEWLQTALKLLEAEGVEAIRVVRLARELGISKSGFYWHFKDRDDLRNQMVEYWAHEFTEVVTKNPTLREGDPRKRLEQTMLMILEHDLTRYEVPMRAWAEADPGIARRVRQVYRQRLDFLREIFRDLGFEGDDLEMRTRLFTCYHTWERAMFSKESKKSLRKLIKLRVDLLAKK